jgi:hypothetical protein
MRLSMADLSDPVATLRISPARRIFATAIQVGLGLVLLSTAASLPEPAPLGLAVLIGFGLIALWGGWSMYKATANDIVLTREGVFDSAGTELALMENIDKVDRSFFAFKPSNGFMIRLKEPRPRRWVPGVWWRYGTRVGVGGATNGKAARDMADVIALMKADPSAGFLSDREG